jgi:hypothetical protein
MPNTYKTQALATKMAEKMNAKTPGKDYVVHQLGATSFGVMTAADIAALSNPPANDTQASAPAKATGKAAGKPAKATKAAKSATPGKVVSLFIAGAKNNAQYVVTPPMGTGKKGPVERWFLKTLLKSVTDAEVKGVKGVLLVGETRVFASRGIDVSAAKEVPAS